MSFLGKALSPVLGIVGGAVNSAWSAHNAREANQMSLNNWIYQQSNKHQLEVQDLRAAGLNPILSATNGQVAGGLNAPMATADVGMSDAVNSSLAFKQLKLEEDKVKLQADMQNKQFELMKAQVLNTTALTEKLVEEARSARVDADYREKTILSNLGLTDAQANLLSTQAFWQPEISRSIINNNNSAAAAHAASAHLSFASADEVRAMTYNIKSELPKLVNEGKISNYKRFEAEKELEFIQKHPTLDAITRFVRRFGPVTDLATSSASTAAKFVK